MRGRPLNCPDSREKFFGIRPGFLALDQDFGIRPGFLALDTVLPLENSNLDTVLPLDNSNLKLLPTFPSSVFPSFLKPF